FTPSATPSPDTLPLHDALPISPAWETEPMVRRALDLVRELAPRRYAERYEVDKRALDAALLRSAAASAGVEVTELSPDTSLFSTDRKSTRLNSSHVSISYALFC